MKFTIQGITDEVDTCDCCGRTKLKRTVALLNENGSEVFFGTECAAQALKLPATDVRKAARSAQAARDAAASKARRAAFDAEFAAWSKFLRERTGLSEVAPAIQALGGIANARAAFRASK